MNKSVYYTASKVELSNSLYVSAHQNPMIHAYGVSKVNFASREKFISIANGVCRQAFIFFATSYFSLTAEAAEKRAQKICPFTGPPSYVRAFFKSPVVDILLTISTNSRQNGGSVDSLLPVLHASIYTLSSYYASGCLETTQKARVDLGGFMGAF